MRRLVVLAAAFWLAGCVTVPDAVQGSVDESVTLNVVRLDESIIRGQPVRWGGLVAAVQNKEGQSWIEIVDQPLDETGRPVGGDVSGGRFIAIVQGMVDPLIAKTGREITVMGSLQPVIEGKINEQPYRYPVIAVSGYHLWQQQRDYHPDGHVHGQIWIQSGYWSPYWYAPPYPYYPWRPYPPGYLPPPGYYPPPVYRPPGAYPPGHYPPGYRPPGYYPPGHVPPPRPYPPGHNPPGSIPPGQNPPPGQTPPPGYQPPTPPGNSPPVVAPPPSRPPESRPPRRGEDDNPIRRKTTPAGKGKEGREVEP